MGKPIQTNPVADLPVNWNDTQIIAAEGQSVGLSQKHGYNYLGGKINEALTDIGAVNDFCGKIQPVKKSVTLPAASWTLGGQTGGMPYYVQTVNVSPYVATDKTRPDIFAGAAAIAALIASKTSAMWFQNNNGSISAVSLLNKPTAAITVDIMLSEVDA